MSQPRVRLWTGERRGEWVTIPEPLLGSFVVEQLNDPKVTQIQVVKP